MPQTWIRPPGALPWTFTLLAGLGLLACESDQSRPLEQGGGFRRVDAATMPDMGSGGMGGAGGVGGTGGAMQMQDADLPEEVPDAAEFEQVPFAVETRVGERRTPAGLENRVTCQVLDQQGAPISGHETVVEVHPDSGYEITETGLIGERARDYRLVCTAPMLGLRDPTPADWTVEPSATARVVAELSTDLIPAGETVEISCRTFDAYGNETDPAGAQPRIEPQPARLVTRPGGIHQFFTAGEFDVTCVKDGADSAPGAALTVQPGLPARIDVGLFPERPVYRVGNVVELTTIVSDEYENTLTGVPLVFQSDPDLPAFGQSRFQAVREGRYTLSATVNGPTLNDEELSAGREILVDFGGPGIDCERPVQGEVLLRPEDGQMTIQGQVADIAGLASVTVDGEPAALSADGTFTAQRPSRWGLNVHEVIAIDNNGEENSALCIYFAADDFLAEDSPLVDALLLRLGQGAIDDGAPDNPLNSIADILRRIINSAGLRDTVHQAAAAQNPIVPNECRARVLGVCLFRFGADYTDLRIDGPNTLEIQLVQGGITVGTSIRGINIFARLRGTLGNRVRITAHRITVRMTFDLGLRFDGTPTVGLRRLDEVSVGDLDADFSGFITGAILNLAFELFEGLIRRTVTDAIRDFLQDNISETLQGLLRGIDVGDLAQGFEVPSLTDGPPVPLTVAPRLSTIDFAPGRALIGVQTRVDGPARVAGRSPGVPMPPNTFMLDLPADRTVGAGVALAMLNQVMHRLWRAGYFDAEAGGLVNGVGADLPEGVEVFLRLPTPPAVVGINDRATVRVFLGPATAGVVVPGLFAEPFRVTLAAAVDANVRLEGERDVVFDGVRVAELHLDFNGAQVSARSRAILEDTLTRILQRVVDQALNDGLPVIPLPEFVIPESLNRFGLPAGTTLGLKDARLTGTEGHWILDGNFRQ